MTVATPPSTIPFSRWPRRTALRRTAWRTQIAGRLLPSEGFDAAGGGRLRPPPAVPLFRCRPAVAVRHPNGWRIEHKDAIAAFLQRLWDAGLRVSHSVRTPAECLEVHDQNTELNVSLLDQRYLAGDRRSMRSWPRRLPRFLQASREPLVRNLARLTRERHARYADTFYHLEPNVKETPGGLRDYQLVRWLDQLNAGFARTAAQSWTRSFASWRGCAASCTARPGATRTCSPSTPRMRWPNCGRMRDAALWMREYYRHARAVYRAAIRRLEISEAQSSSLFAQFRDWRSRLANADFSVHRERAHFRAPQRLDVEPELVLRTVRVRGAARRPPFARSRPADRGTPAAAAPPLRRAAASVAGAGAPLALPHAALALRSMHDTGVLTALFPELEQIECLVVRDFYHRYTVDEHTLVAIESLNRAGSPYSELRGELQQPATLLFALLFHDSGKSAAAAGHVEAGVRLAEAAGLRIRMPAPEREEAAFLIRRHLDLSLAMQSRDIFDPQTRQDLAHQVETVERLKALTLLTYADISAVNPTVMTPWRAQQLWQLYRMLYRELTLELETDRLDAVPSEFLRGLPKRYLRTHTPEEIQEHIELEERSRPRGAAVALKRLESAWQLTLVAADRPGLFASAAGTLSSFGMNILRAEAFSNRRGMVLDTFTFEDPHRTLDLNPPEVDRLRATVERAITGKLDVRALLRNRPRPTLPSRKARVPARIAFDGTASQSATLIEIVAEDRPGLLYDLASAISVCGANIEVVLIDTQAHKAIDVFYVTSAGGKLSEAQQATMEEALRKSTA